MSGKTKSQINDWLKANPGSQLVPRMSDEAFEQMLDRTRNGGVELPELPDEGISALAMARNKRYRGDPNLSPPPRVGGKRGRKMINLMGQTFRMLTVVGGPQRETPGWAGAGSRLTEIVWLCRCKCGAEKWVSTANLRHGRVVACDKNVCRAEGRRGRR